MQLKYSTYETNPCIEHLKQKLLELLKPKVHICNFNFKFPVDCDAMMHGLKDSINLKYSELLTKAISKCNLI